MVYNHLKGGNIMRRNIVTSLLAACLLIGTTGCMINTTGEANWEVYGGVRTRQLSEEPASVEFQSSLVDKITDSLIDGEISNAE